MTTKIFKEDVSVGTFPDLNTAFDYFASVKETGWAIIRERYTIEITYPDGTIIRFMPFYVTKPGIIN